MSRTPKESRIPELKPLLLKPWILELPEIRILLPSHQPIHRLFPRLERRIIPLRKRLEVLVVHVWHTFGSHPCRALHIRTIQRRALLSSHRHVLIDLRPGEIGQRKHRPRRMPRDIRPHQFQQNHHLLLLQWLQSITKIICLLCFTILQPLVDRFGSVIPESPPPRRKPRPAPNPAPTHPSLQPPPGPDALRLCRQPFCATGPITLPACTRRSQILCTPTISATLPFDADPRITTPDPILSRN